jgi:hypothetical protein
MANNHGGPRTPSNPAPVSAPGALSRRTDGGPSQTTVPMTGMGYGENADYNDIQSSAPLAAAPSVSNTRARKSSPTGQGAAATPLFSPSGFPEEPVTAGAPFGPGPGPMSRTPLPTRPKLSDTLNRVSAFSSDPTLVAISEILARRGL